jgi:tight adherence protein B
MLASTLMPFVVFLLAACSAGGLLLAAFYPRVAGRSVLDRRILLLIGDETSADTQKFEEHSRRRSVEATLREAEEKLKAKAKNSNKPSLLMRIRQAELGWSKKTYCLVCLGIGIAAFLLLLGVIGLGAVLAAGFGMSAGLLLPHLYVNFKRSRRFKRFTAEFPNAIDIIVRGVRAGLPVVDCMKTVAAETRNPVKNEFKTLFEDQAMGMPFDEAVQRLPERIPLPETSFFAIVIAIQTRTGGSLSEALGNLSTVLRERSKMRMKIKAMSSEAKASAWIIGSLPIIVGGLVYFTSPDYIALLFTTSLGNLIIGVSAVWMLIGIFVMRKMIAFDH